MTDGASIIDIKELVDGSDRVVAFLYIDDAGRRFYQATTFMRLALVERLGFRFLSGALTSDVKPYDGSDVGLTVRSCRPKHVMSTDVIRNPGREMEAAFYNDLDVLPFEKRRYYLERWASSGTPHATPTGAATPAVSPTRVTPSL